MIGGRLWRSQESGVRSQDGADTVRMSDSEGVEETDGGQDGGQELDLQEFPLRLEDARGRTNSEGAEVEEQVQFGKNLPADYQNLKNQHSFQRLESSDFDSICVLILTIRKIPHTGDKASLNRCG